MDRRPNVVTVQVATQELDDHITETGDTASGEVSGHRSAETLDLSDGVKQFSCQDCDWKSSPYGEPEASEDLEQPEE